MVLSLLVGACTATDRDATPPAPSGTEGADVGDPVDQIDSTGNVLPDPSSFPDLQLALVWHQHQPQYPVIDGTISRPWVRLHASKDYLDMVDLVGDYPDIRLTVNLSPVLMDQLVNLEAGANDRYEAIASIPAQDLTSEDRSFIVERFFDINGKILELSPRFEELREIRDTGGNFSDGDITDLVTLFHLFWIDPELRAQNRRTSELAEQDRNFSHQDTLDVLAFIDELAAAVLPAHRTAWESGQVEIITSPLSHPILPLVFDSDSALEGDPSGLLPREAFQEPADALEHVQSGLVRTEELLGQTPRGMWPAEGAVSQAVMPVFAEAGVDWIATGEDVLARSLGIGTFDRNEKNVVIEAQQLYRPYSVETESGAVGMFFRDNRISDLIAFDYSESNPTNAATDFINQLDNLRAQLALQGVTTEDAPVVTVVMDGENAWEHYPNDGRDFLNQLYSQLSATDWLQTTTPSRYLAENPGSVGELTNVAAASWFSPDFATWIGEPEEARAWELLALARRDLAAAERQGVSAQRLDTARQAMLAAQGSDWFWWYGSDQDSGDDAYFDAAYRELLGQVYDSLGQARPVWVSVPIVPDPRLVPAVSNGEPQSISIDGNPSDWDTATTFDFTGSGDLVSTLKTSVNANVFAMLLDGEFDRGAEIYLQMPNPDPETAAQTRQTSIDGKPLGIDATHLIRWSTSEGACLAGELPPSDQIGIYPQSCTAVDSAESEAGLEMAVALAQLGTVGVGDAILVRIQAGATLSPTGGPVIVPVPDIQGFETVIAVNDMIGDDTGPGSYSYPTDDVFLPGSFDLVKFEAGTSGTDLVFSFQIDSELRNPWNSPVGLALQSFDVYFDVDPGRGTGRNDLVDGRNASLPPGNGWEAAILVEGWDRAVATSQRDGSYVEASDGLIVSVLVEKGLVTVRVPAANLPPALDLQTAGIAVALLGQEEFSAEDVRRVRDIEPSPQQWRFGGGNSVDGDTRIIDALSDRSGSQQALAEGTLVMARP